jgi:MOSC domain-containing protein YiiM
VGGELLSSAVSSLRRVGSVLSVNLADVRTIERRGKPVRTGIWKLPADGRVLARREGLLGDVQADRRVHGGPDMAVYAYAREDTRASKSSPRPRRQLPAAGGASAR